jgi:hypothetical protein
MRRLVPALALAVLPLAACGGHYHVVHHHTTVVVHHHSIGQPMVPARIPVARVCRYVVRVSPYTHRRTRVKVCR